MRGQSVKKDELDKLIQSLCVIEQNQKTSSTHHFSMASFILGIEEKQKPVMLKGYFETMNRADYKNMLNSFSESSVASPQCRVSHVKNEGNVVSN